MPRPRIKPIEEYVPRGIPLHVCRFFAENPDEELTSADITIKFDIARQSVTAILELAVLAGLLSKRIERQGRLVNVYGAGPNIVRMAPQDCKE
jgi:hypothetical protein